MTDPIPLHAIPATVDPSIVDTLDAITARAVEGDYGAIAIITVTKDGEIETCWSDASLWVLLAGASRLAYEINQALD